MRSAFVITSALHTKFGVYNTGERLLQTIATIDSVEKYANPEKIIVLEMGGGGSLTEAEQTEFTSRCDLLMDYTKDQDVIALHNSTPNWDVVKNITETSRFAAFLQTCMADPTILEGIDRVFKISGRYILNEQFDLAQYEQAENKITFKARQPSQFKPETTGGVTQQYFSRLWSFDAKLLPHIAMAYMNMIKTIVTRINAGGYIDIEHSLFACMPKEFIIELNTVGVEGNLGPNGILVKD